MKRFRVIFRNPGISFSSKTHSGKILTSLVLLLAGVSTASATSPLSKVSCGGSTYSGAATDACSVSLTAKSAGKTYVSLSSSNPAVTVPSRLTVRSGAISAGFNATVSSVLTAQTATITAQAGGVSKTFIIALSPATASGTGALSLNTTSIGFGSVFLNTPVAQALTLTSTGTAAVTVNSDAVSGTGFSVSGASFPATLNPGQSVTLEVQFDPQTTGAFSGQVSISSSVATKTVALSGTGASHQVDLSWSAPSGSTDPIAGYNVYRAPSGSTSYQKLNASVQAQTGYTDSSVQAGSSYVYVVKSVDSSGVESAPSNATSITVP